MRFVVPLITAGLSIVTSPCGWADEPKITGVIQQALAIVPSIQPDGLREQALELTAVLQAKAGNATGALVAIEGIRTRDRKWAALASWAHAKAQKGDAQSALQITETIPDATLQVEALADIAEVQAREGGRSVAKETIQQALLHATAIQKEAARDPALAAIAVVQGKSGELDAGRRTASWIKNEGIRTEVVSDIAEIQAQAGDLAGAQATLAAVSDQDKRESLLATRVVPALARQGDVETVAAAADQLTGGFYRAMALVRLAELQNRVGQQQEAEQTFARIRQLTATLAVEMDKDPELLSIAPAQASAGDLPGARQTVSQMKRDSVKLRALSLIAGTLASSGNVVGARDTAASIPEGPLRDSARRLVALAQAEEGEVGRAREIIGSIRDESIRASSIVDLALAMVRIRDFRGAHETAVVIPRDDIRLFAIITVARAQTRAGDADGAATWASTLTEPLQRWAVLVGIASGLLPPSAQCSTREAKRLTFFCA